MAINLTEIQNIDTLYDAVTWINTQTETLFFTFIIVAILIVLILSLRRYGLVQGITLGSFVCFVLSFIFGSIGLVHFSLTLAMFLFTVLGAFYLYVSRDSG